MPLKKVNPYNLLPSDTTPGEWVAERPWLHNWPVVPATDGRIEMYDENEYEAVAGAGTVPMQSTAFIVDLVFGRKEGFTEAGTRAYYGVAELLGRLPTGADQVVVAYLRHKVDLTGEPVYRGLYRPHVLSSMDNA